MAKFPTDPQPKTTPDNPLPLDWRVTASHALPHIIPPPPCRFADVMEQRRSVREMRQPHLRDVINTIAFATNVRQIKPDDVYQRSRRPSPSGGALHAVEVLLVWPGRQVRAFRYDPFDHRLQRLVVSDLQRLTDFLKDTAAIVPNADGALLLLAGNRGRVEDLYERPDSLLWRDAGALIQTIHLSATAYGQACCPLGVLGGGALDAIGMDDQLTALGIVAIGSPVSDQAATSTNRSG